VVDSQLAGEAVPQVLEIGEDDVLVNIDPELDLQRVERRRVDAVQRGQHRLGLVAGHEPRQSEVDGEGRPKGDEEQAQAATEVCHPRAAWVPFMAYVLLILAWLGQLTGYR